MLRPAPQGFAAQARSQVVVDRCTGCGKPAHASETDDDGYHPECRPASAVDLQRILVVTDEPALLRIANALRALTAALPDAHYVTVGASGYVSIGCSTDEGTRALAASIGMAVHETGNNRNRWLTTEGVTPITVYGPHRPIVETPAIDETAVTAALRQAEAAQ